MTEENIKNLIGLVVPTPLYMKFFYLLDITPLTAYMNQSLAGIYRIHFHRRQPAKPHASTMLSCSTDF
jgi:hypothetical protein